ncbi:serine hydrolase domain-containing protein [Actinoplanes solisilvae]|uniref:serine hydrolase domain-containing protein n=1 Tax=Actinoplanes solisilvae TaxID=2486853 RepID=UPI0013E38CD5|nr:serine hydrolase domain-containing protein [Actinoplanes solisilvae]
MSDLGERVRATADELSGSRDQVVVAALRGDEVEIAGDPDAVFEIGSITKVFTALALARDGGLDEPLLPRKERGGVAITLEHLARHTSGLPRLPTGMLLKALLHPLQPDPYAGCTADFLDSALARTRLKSVPGQKFRYSNFGAGLLGLALSRRAGVSYDELIARLTGPLGMTSTGVTLEPLQPHRASGQPTPPWNLADLAGAGGLRSTAADLILFLRAQLTDASIGWMERQLPGGRSQLWHNGATGGSCAFAGLEPGRGVAVVALSNTMRLMDKPAVDLLTTLGETE